MNVPARLKIAVALACAALVAACSPMATQAPAQASASGGTTEVLWLGQASVRIKSPGGKIIMIDPWITGGPKTPPQYKTNLAALGKIDLLLVTHAHVDHVGDSAALA